MEVVSLFIHGPCFCTHSMVLRLSYYSLYLWLIEVGKIKVQIEKKLNKRKVKEKKYNKMKVKGLV